MKTIFKSTLLLLTVLTTLAVVTLTLQGCKQQDNRPNEISGEVEQQLDAESDWPIEDPN